MRVAILDTEVGPIDQSQVLKVDTQGNIGYVVFPPQSKFWKLQLSASMLGCPYKAIQPEGLSRVSLSTKVAACKPFFCCTSLGNIIDQTFLVIGDIAENNVFPPLIAKILTNCIV